MSVCVNHKYDFTLPSIKFPLQNGMLSVRYMTGNEIKRKRLHEDYPPMRPTTIITFTAIARSVMIAAHKEEAAQSQL